MHNNGNKRILNGITLLVIFISLNGTFLLAPRQAHAIPVEDIPARIFNKAESAVKKIDKKLKQALVTSITTGIINTMTYVANTAAYNLAVNIASGGDADLPLFDPRPPADYFRYIGMSAANEAISVINAENAVGGFLAEFGLCTPIDPYILLAKRVGVRSVYERPTLEADPLLGIENACGLNDIRRNWQSFVADTKAQFPDDQTRNEFILSTLSSSMEPEVNEFSSGMQLYADTIGRAATDAKNKFLPFLNSDGFQAVKNYITEAQETPASMVQFDFENQIDKQSGIPNQIGAALISNTDAILQVGVMAGSVFSNTLLSELTDRLYSGLFENVAYDDSPFDEDAGVTGSVDRAKESFKSLSTFTPLQVSDFNLLSEFSTCSTDIRSNSRRLYNCVIDTSFASVLARADAGDPLTIQEAIDEGYINGDWALIPPTDQARNQNSKCYSYGFCYSNLVKLRKARIIPIGWELAANSEDNSDSSPKTLQFVIDSFNECNSDGELDSDYPWCHLIDPDWVLTYPQHQCNTLAYGQLLEASGTDFRAEECVDYKSCIDEDDEGNCTGGYGYCVREQNIWRFRGDSCPEEYASCQGFTDRNGEDVNYLTTTIDSGECGDGNVGCLWYETVKEEDSAGAFDWPEITNTETAENASDAYKERVYFNSNVETCDESNGGCTQLIERTDDLNLNLVVNSSFEVDADGNGVPDAWLTTDIDTLNFDTENDVGRTANSAMSTGAGTVFQPGLTLGQSRFFTFSFFAAQSPDATSSDNTIQALVSLTDQSGAESVDLTGTSFTGDCAVYSALIKNVLLITATPDSDSYERFECIFTAPTLRDKSSLLHAVITFDANLLSSSATSSVLIDDVQLEQEADATTYHADYSDDYNSLSFMSVKLPPDYLGCDGGDDDPAECEGYARICAENNAGCNEYTPMTGDPTVFGKVTQLDECSASCVGYDTFKQEATLYEPDGEFPIYFIPDTAESCTAEAVGCDEFTNLSTEDKEYFTYLRGCVTEAQAEANTNSDKNAVFYTWEGSDIDGYQLKVWDLLESNLIVSTYEYADSGEVDSNPGGAPCSTWYSDDTGIHCEDDKGVSAGYLAADTDACDEHEDIFSNPDCREFYDEAGVIHYRQWTDTVTVNNACVTYRKTTIAGEDATAWQDNCEGSGGFFNTANNECVYYGFNEESNICSAEESGCRNYTGGRSANSRTALIDLFEDDTLENWDGNSASDVSLSNDSIATDGHSLKSVDTTSVWTHLYDYGSACADENGCDSGTDTLGAECTVQEGEQYCGTLENQLFGGKTYFLSFWAKGDGQIDVGFDTNFDPSSGAVIDIEGDGSLLSFGSSITLTDEWERFSLGPLDMDSITYPEFGEGTVLVFEPFVGVTFWIDTIVLREGEDDIAVIMDSWITPAICDQNLEGETSPQYQLGCQEYLDVNADTAYLKSFGGLCDEDQVGCAGYFKTNQTEDINAAIVGAVCNNVDADEDEDDIADTATGSTGCYMFTTDSGGTAFDEASGRLCTITLGQSSCTFDLDFYIPETLLSSLDQMSHISYVADTQLVEADRDIYAIVDSGDLCDSTEIGCMEVGVPVFSADLSVVDSWTTTFLLNLPEDYGDILCSASELFCEEFESTDEGTFYFKDPVGHVCEYTDSRIINGTSYRGWFREGTDEFCYGVGFCSESEDSDIACSLDSDCADHDDGDFGECDISVGEYLIGGDYSAQWRNGDTDYEGWVGLCNAEHDGCSEFRDPLDFDDSEFYGETDGGSYFFIDNENLDENTLLSAQKCNGEVSQKRGCTLFYDTGDTGFDYNSTATYIASARADVLFGKQPFDLVDPIDCDDEARSSITTIGGEEIDLCAQRCVYEDADLTGSSTTTSRRTGANAEDVNDGREWSWELDEIYVLSGSCYDDSDCTGYEGRDGDMVQGTCETEVLMENQGSEDSNVYQDVDRLENDTNRVLKVSRDRSCSEWLTCSSSYTVWDEATASYKTVCDGIDLCTDYSASGDESFCTAWDADDPAVVLSEDRYASRDVTWYGEEYSGNAIPNKYPLQHLSQVNIAPRGYCAFDSESCETDDDCSTDAGTGDTCLQNGYCGKVSDACDVDDDCAGRSSDDYSCQTGGDSEYRLAMKAGSCDVGYADSCTVGFCENSSAPCTGDDDCGTGEGSCVTGTCYDITEVDCSNDGDCNEITGEFCLAGTCATDKGSCDIDGA
ncbi:MAG: hypothetical protein Q8P30_00690, partial [Candidatus Uhrbacteria bacterium]|nr:hypothetical protein [Candidatus Uhrbacteria bacterium]